MLYKIVVEGKDVFGVRLAIGSDGLAIFEDRATKAIHKVKPDEIEEVLPYSFSVRYTPKGADYHYWGVKGEVAVGDVLLHNANTGKDGGFGIAVVYKLDTKSRKACKSFDGLKLTGTPLTVIGDPSDVVDDE